MGLIGQLRSFAGDTARDSPLSCSALKEGAPCKSSISRVLRRNWTPERI
jgi:hypothetical protein